MMPPQRKSSAHLWVFTFVFHQFGAGMYRRRYPQPNARSSRTTAVMRDRWVKAWGKLPNASPV
jgi:hypothetical protein